jgi:cytosine/adenosine deaminase-related metal-dependent hydrolase
MVISNIFIAGEAGPKEIRIGSGKILSVNASSDPTLPGSTGFTPSGVGDTKAISLPGAIAFPGLINSHDHLDFNLFPALGNTIYGNYTQWGKDIHANNHPAIREVLAIPQDLRIRWGMYKNLINGVTTVVNHGAWLPTGEENLTAVFQHCYCLHSPGFEKKLKWQLLRPRRHRWTLVLHVGEGTDELAHREIDHTLRWNLFRRPLIGIHGVAMDERQATGFRALIWCPASNHFLLGRTAAVDKLKEQVPILFGTDSTLTAGWNAWDHFRMARAENRLTDRELLDTLTTTPAAIWGFTGSGAIAAGSAADLVIAQPDTATNTTESAADTADSAINTPDGSLNIFFGLNPADILLVIRKGVIRLFDPLLQPALIATGADLKDFSCITVQGRRKFIAGDLPGLMEKIRKFHPGVIFPVDAA